MFMTREVLDSGVKISAVTKTENSGSGNSGSTTTEIDGIVVEMMAGLLPTSHELWIYLCCLCIITA